MQWFLPSCPEPPLCPADSSLPLILTAVHFYGSSPRSPSPSISDSFSDPDSIVVLSREPSSSDPLPSSTTPSSTTPQTPHSTPQDSFVVVNEAEVQVNMFADAVENRAKHRTGSVQAPPKRSLFGAVPGYTPDVAYFAAQAAARRGTPLTEAALLEQIERIIKPAVSEGCHATGCPARLAPPATLTHSLLCEGLSNI